MDILALSFLAPKIKEKFETKTDTVATATNATPVKDTTASKGSNIFMTIFSIVIGIYAAYLSWTCNTATQTNIVLKVIFAIFAFLFGLFYLILYLIFRWGDCRYIKEKLTPPEQTQPVMNAGRRRR